MCVLDNGCLEFSRRCEEEVLVEMKKKGLYLGEICNPMEKRNGRGKTKLEHCSKATGFVTHILNGTEFSC